MSRAGELAGQRFGKLVVIRRAPKGYSTRNAYWVCKCDCGRESIVRGARLRAGLTASCGCEAGPRRKPNARKKDPLYSTWRSMRARCLNSNHVAWHHYGGRGIAICDRWIASFDAFREDMGSRPSARHSLDRIDNDGNYEPGNVRWATAHEQRMNQRTPMPASRCRNGHPRTSENTIIGKDGVTRCRECRRATQRNWKMRQRQARSPYGCRSGEAA